MYFNFMNNNKDDDYYIYIIDIKLNKKINQNKLQGSNHQKLR